MAMFDPSSAQKVCPCASGQRSANFWPSHRLKQSPHLFAMHGGHDVAKDVDVIGGG